MDIYRIKGICRKGGEIQMSDLLQITTPVQARDFGNLSHNNQNRQTNLQQNPTGQVFDLGVQNEVVKVNNRSEDQAQQNLKDDGGLGLLSTGSGLVKNPSAALESAKAIMSQELLAAVRESGDSDALGKLTEFASEVMLTPESLQPDMVMQQNNSTIYGDKLWNVLKTLVDMTDSPVVKEAVVDFAKAAADLSAKDEILRSLSANFKFLSREAAPGKAVSEELMAASKALSGADAQKNFNALKPTLLKLLSYTEHSLLLNDDTKNLLPLIKHSMSRYTDSPEALKSSFEALLNISEGIELTDKQKEALGLDPKAAQPENAALTQQNASGQQNAPLESLAKEQSSPLQQLLKGLGLSGNEGEKAIGTPAEETLSPNAPTPQSISPESAKQNYTSNDLAQTQKSMSPQTASPQLKEAANPLTQKLMDLFDEYISKNEYIAPDAKLRSLFDPETAKHESAQRSAVNLLAAGANHMAGRISPDTMTKIVSTIDFTEGADALQKVLSAVIPNTPAMRNALQSIFDDLEQTRDLDAMISKLNTILENIDDSHNENLLTLAQGMNAALGEMAADGKYSVTTSTSMETLTDFITKNIDNSFLHSLSGMNQSDMVQNMLTAPGVFTPLIHQFIPLDAFGIKAFGEMWIDPHDDELTDNVKNNKNGKDSSGSHMFICFDIEDTGYFELEIYEKDKNLSVLLLCPENTEKDFSAIKDSVPKIAAANGYHVTASIVEGMQAKRSLDQVFPRLAVQRSGLNVKI